MGHLARLGVRRQAKLDTADYLILADDLAKFDLNDIAGGLDDIAKYPRREGETAFPELPRLKQAILERKAMREAAEVKQRDADEAQYRRDHPEEFCSWAEVWASPEAQAVAQKIEMAKARMQAPKVERPLRTVAVASKSTPEEIEAHIAATTTPEQLQAVRERIDALRAAEEMAAQSRQRSTAELMDAVQPEEKLVQA